MKKTRRIILPIAFILLVALALSLTACGDPCKNGHKIAIDAAVAATCENDGLTQGSHCTVCNTVIAKQETVAKLGHKVGGFMLIEAENKINSTCMSCSYVYDSYSAEKLTDDWSDAWATEEKVDFDLNSFAIVYPSNSANIINEVNEFATAIFDKTGLRLTTVSAKEYKASGFAGAIYVGDTGFAESNSAKKALNAGYSYILRATDKKIVVAGRADADVVAALNFMVANYLSASSSNASIPSCTLGTNPRDVSLDLSNFYIVIDHNTYDLPYHAYVGGSTSVNYDNNYDVAMTLASTYKLEDKIIKDSTALPNRPYISKFDGKTYAQRTKAIDSTTTHLILLGQVDHPASIAFRANLPANCHGFKIIDDKTVVIAGHNDYGLELAMQLFRKEYNTNADKIFTSGYTSIEITNSAWNVDFPRPTNDNIKLYNTDTSMGDTLQLLYTGSGVSEQAFDAYCETLQKAGYTLYGSINKLGQLKGATFVNESKNSSLHVIYNPFAAQAQHSTMDSKRVQTRTLSSAKDEDGKAYSYTVTYPLSKYDPCIRVISSPLNERITLPTSSKPYSNEIANSIKVDLPGEELLTKNYDYKKVTETSISAVGVQANSVGTAYVIQLEDGSFIVVDGGQRQTDMLQTNDEGDNLYKVMSKLHYDAFKDEAGGVPETITIRAWYLTHSHYDHFYGFSAFAYQYGKGNKVDTTKATLVDNKYKADIQNIITHIVSNSVQNISNSNTELQIITNFISSIQYSNGGGANYVRAHAGQVLYFANVKLEILMTPEDYNPIRMSNTNDGNTIIRMNVSSKDNQSSETSMLFTGDACINQSRYLCATYGDYLESDMVTMAHHGNIGSETALYEEVQARILWYPHTVSSFISYSTGSLSSWPHNVSVRIVQMECLEYVYVSGSGAKFGTVTLKFDKATPLYDNPCDVVNGNKIGIATSISAMGDTTKPVYDNPNYKEKTN